jgi:hypothetical protein
LLTAVFVFFNGATLLVAPEAYPRLYVITCASGMEIGARRFAPAVIGLGALLIPARDLAKGRFLTALMVLTGLVFWGVAATGIHAYFGDVARPTILVAVDSATVLGTVFLLTGRTLTKSL